VPESVEDQQLLPEFLTIAAKTTSGKEPARYTQRKPQQRWKNVCKTVLRWPQYSILQRQKQRGPSAERKESAPLCTLLLSMKCLFLPSCLHSMVVGVKGVLVTWRQLGSLSTFKYRAPKRDSIGTLVIPVYTVFTRKI